MIDVADNAHQTRRRHVTAGRRASALSGQKHAFARSGLCLGRRRAVQVGKPQVGSGVEPDSHHRIVGASSFYDPATGQFLTRDPIEAITRSPYAYVNGNPLNATDPTGLFCEFWSDDCDLTPVADFAGGVLNGLSLGLAEPWIESQGVDLDSAEAFGGSIVGTAATLPLFITYPSTMAGASTAASGFTVANECALGSDRSGCARAAFLGILGVGVPWFTNTAAERLLLRYADLSPHEFRSLWGWFLGGLSGVPPDGC